MVERIRILLESRQLTPTQFADLIGVARPIISHVLSGRNKPSLEVVQRILAAMPDLSMAWLLNGTEPMLTTARAAASAPPVSRSAEPVVSPLPLAPSQTVAPGLAAIPVALVQGDQLPGKQVANAIEGTPEPIPPLAPPSGVPSYSLAAALVPAGLVPAAQPANTTIGRPLMPRRFPVKPPTTGLPASAATPQAPVLPVPLFSAGSPGATATPVMIPAVPVAAVGITGPKMEFIEKEQIAAVSDATSGVAAGPLAAASVVAAAAPLGFAGTPVATPAPVPVAAAPAAGIPAPTQAAPVTRGTPSIAPTLASDMASALFTGTEKPIRRIVIFYRDGSFADYQPE